ncbi:flagellar protein FliT [Luteibacter rhizovicinus]|nr:flagellar protein FliT [Luteibacter rhizovicinus]
MSLTEAMHAAATESRWDELATLEAERDPVLHAGTMRSTSETLETLKSIMLIDSLIRELVSAARDEVAVLWDESRRMQRAVAAYSQV